MSISLLQHTQGIRGFQFQSWKYKKQTVFANIKQKRENQFCTACKSHNVTPCFLKIRRIKGLRIGGKQLILNVAIHRLNCHDCGKYRQEAIPFCSASKVRITKALERSIIELRPEMTISALAKYFRLPWHTVKEVEKRHLEKKYKHIRLKDVEVIGIDEIYIGTMGYLTIVRDLGSGAVLNVSEGKGQEALDDFTVSLKHSKAKIKAVAMDMGPAYAAWAKANCKDAVIVYDHFHVIQSINNKIDKLRRQTMKQANEELKQKLKNKRFLLLMNEESLDDKDQKELAELKSIFADLGTAVFMKECLRKIYDIAPNADMAKIALAYWCKLAKASEISCLKTMAKTIASRIDGIVAFWDNNRLTSAGMEGFNSKIRWLIKQAYGYHDEKYFHLKIFDLPTTKITKEL